MGAVCPHAPAFALLATGRPIAAPACPAHVFPKPWSGNFNASPVRRLQAWQGAACSSLDPIMSLRFRLWAPTSISNLCFHTLQPCTIVTMFTILRLMRRLTHRPPCAQSIANCKISKLSRGRAWCYTTKTQALCRGTPSLQPLSFL